MTSSSADIPSALPPAGESEGGSSLWKDAWHRLARNKLAVVSGVVLICLGLICVIGPLLVKNTYNAQNLALGATAPSAKHWLGTDTLGRDQFVRILFGGRVSLMVAICATFVSLTIGVIYGAISGFVGGKLDPLMIRT